jgi:SAM-dependent methyltransferase
MNPAARDDAGAYGDACAAFYDRIYPPPAPAQVDCLRRLAGDGRALELGIGSGRVAIALADAGVRICGVEASGAMRAELLRRAGALHIPVHAADFAQALPAGPFDLVFALVDTLALLPSREAQQSCLALVAESLTDRGIFLHESCDDGVHASDAPESLHHRVLIDGQTYDYPVRLLPLPPSRLDALAACSGLELHDRWGDWRGTPWSPGSRQSISLYRRERS